MELRTPLTDEQRQAVVAEAYSWVGTRYHHLGDLKGVGVDCAMLLVRIYCDLGLAPKFDPRPYSPEWFLHHSEEKYLKWISKYCEEVKYALPGDIVLYQFGRCAAHGAVVVNDVLMIHAYAPAGVVEIKERWAPMAHGFLHSLWSPQVVT